MEPKVVSYALPSPSVFLLPYDHQGALRHPVCLLHFFASFHDFQQKLDEASTWISSCNNNWTQAGKFGVGSRTEPLSCRKVTEPAQFPTERLNGFHLMRGETSSGDSSSSDVWASWLTSDVKSCAPLSRWKQTQCQREQTAVAPCSCDSDWAGAGVPSGLVELQDGPKGAYSWVTGSWSEGAGRLSCLTGWWRLYEDDGGGDGEELLLLIHGKLSEPHVKEEPLSQALKWCLYVVVFFLIVYSFNKLT